MTLVVAHRGLHHQHRENTLEAFRAARDLGVDGVELDVRQSADGVLVVHHDPAIAGRAIAATASGDLPDYVPTLETALEACGDLSVNVEIKNIDHPSEPTYDASGEFTRRVLATLDAYDGPATCLVSSFDLATCVLVRRLHPERYVGWLLDWERESAPLVERAAIEGLSAVHPHFLRADAAVVALASERGLDVNVWTVNTRHDLAAMARVGVHAIITDEPELARQVLGPERGPDALA